MEMTASPVLRVADDISVGGLHLPLLGHSNIWIEDSLDNAGSFRLAQHVIQQALELTAPGQLEVLVYDEALSGLSSPFEAVNAGGERILTSILSRQELQQTFEFLRTHIHGVKNVIQGTASNLVDFRRRVNYPVESYKLVVLSSDISMLEDEMQNDLATLLRAGPAAGVSFLIHSMTLDVNPFLVGFCDLFTVDGETVRGEDGEVSRAWAPSSAQALIDTAETLAARLAAAEVDPIDFVEVQPLDRGWTACSADGITFAIGKYGAKPITLTLGDEVNQRHNLLITGAVGQGKSNLLSVIIHSLCERYSPEEIGLYLLDFKEGVTLRAFYDRQSGEYLPHARVLGLDADREFGLNVLKHLFGVYLERMRLFKSRGVQNILQFRRAYPDEALPRLVLLIDEFQMMFTDRDQISDESADLLVKGVRLFRACGIHVILASQTIGGNVALMGSSGEALFGQVPVRIALKNSLSESHATLGVKNDGAVHLRARQGIVNLDYGAVSANRKTSIAYADEAVLAPRRRSWWRDVGAAGSPPAVFDGERRPELAEFIAQLKLGVWDPQEPLLPLGLKLDVSAESFAVQFGPEMGRNVAVVGTGDGVGIIGTLLTALVAQTHADEPPEFVFLDLLRDEAWRGRKGQLVELFADSACELRFVGKEEVDAVLEQELAALGTRADRRAPRFIFGVGLERLRTAPAAFAELCRSGPDHGVHVIGWWTKLDTFREHVGYGGEAFFDVRVALRCDAQSAKQFFNNPLLDYKATDDRILVWDSSALQEPVRLVPYANSLVGDQSPARQ